MLDLSCTTHSRRACLPVRTLAWLLLAHAAIHHHWSNAPPPPPLDLQHPIQGLCLVDWTATATAWPELNPDSWSFGAVLVLLMLCLQLLVSRLGLGLSSLTLPLLSLPLSSVPFPPSSLNMRCVPLLHLPSAMRPPYLHAGLGIQPRKQCKHPAGAHVAVWKITGGKSIELRFTSFGFGGRGIGPKR